MKKCLSILALMLASALSAVTLDPLAPGKDYTQLTVSGTADSETVTIKLVDRTEASAPVTCAAEVVAGSFSADFTELKPGHEYAVLVDEVEKGVVVMARDATDGWLYEDAETFAGEKPGTGVWGGDGESSVRDGRIIIAAEIDSSVQESVVYLPTNHFGEVTGYRVKADLSFEGVWTTPRTTDGIFGVCLVTDPLDSSRSVFYIIDGQGWKRTTIVGAIATTYGFEFIVDEDNRRVGYYLIGSDQNTYLGSGAIPDGVPTRFRSVDFEGFGSIDVIEGEATDTKLVEAEVHFDGSLSNGVIRAGMNFTNLVLNGWVRINALHDSSSLGGTIEVRLRGTDGSTRTLSTQEWSGTGGVYGITNVVDSLTIGENYTIEVVVRDSTTGGEQILDGGDWAASGGMGRVTDAWYDEDGYTISGLIPATGEWSVDEGISLTVDNDGVVLVESDGSVSGARAVFTPTNAVPRNGRRSINSFEVSFTSAVDADALPDASGELFGLTLANTNDAPALAVIVNGAWKTVDTGVFAPELGRTYVIDAVCGVADGVSTIEYYVTEESGAVRLVAQGKFRDGSKPYPAEVAFSGDGRFASAVGKFFDTTLFEVEFDPYTGPGTNFTASAVSGTIVVTPTWDTDRESGKVRVTVKNGRGETVVTKEVEFHGTTPIEISVDGLEPGDSYVVEVEVIDTDGPADGDVEFEDSLPTARKYADKWIYEDADTFAGNAERTGDWYFRKSPLREARVVEDPLLGDAIQIEADIASSVNFESTNESQTVVNSTIREVTFEICSETAGYKVSNPEFPTVRSADLAGITIACDDTDGDKLYFSVYNPGGSGSWHILSNAVAALNQSFTFTVIITYPNPNKTAADSITYLLHGSDGKRKQIAFFEPGKKANGTAAIPEVTESYRTRLRFVGSGLVKYFEGECYDAHLADIGGTEYWTIADAIHEIGTSGRVLTPLWMSTYTADINQGWFGVNDPNHWLSIFWPLGYVVEITDRGEIRYYLFHLSDYWIDWAVKEDAVETPEGWQIQSANGLAWLAKEGSTNWISGTVTLASDITNLYEHIWTPIRGFTGTFDGNSKKLVGLTNKGVELCTTNELGMTAYGLFGTASNSVFRGVTFDRVAVTNSADAVASLLGCSIGDVALTNVVIRSGNLAGGGQFVAGVVGYMGDFNDVSVYKNFNAASIVTLNAPLGGAGAAGIANLGLDSSTGSVAVVENENRGAIETTINSTVLGGNVAQILAGSEPLAQFDETKVVVSGNVGTGDVSRVTSLNHDAWSLATLPVVNLAAEVSRQDGDSCYKEFIEANDSTDVLIDPWRKYARMTGAFYQDGVTNEAGRINDQITCSKPGDIVTLQGPCEIWSPIELDRAIILELDNKVVDNVFAGYTFKVADDAGGALVQNGTVTHPAGMLANRAVGDQWYTNNVNAFVWTTNYWDRGFFVNGEFVNSLVALSMALAPFSTVSAPEESAFSVNVKTASIEYNGQTAFSLAPQGYKITDNGDGSYVIELDDNPATPAEISLTLSPNGGTSTVTVKNARTDCEYCLQSVTTLAEQWDKTTDVWVSPETDGGDLIFEVDTSGTSGFFRINTRKK